MVGIFLKWDLAHSGFISYTLNGRLELAKAGMVSCLLLKHPHALLEDDPF
jgi:hypothetical protein